MVKITNYELYTDRGEGWKLEDRFSVEQRHMAINMAKEIEQDKKIPVKIIREIFDIQDNTYMETIEYVSGLGNKDIKNLNKNISKNYPSLNFEEYSDDGNQKKTQTPQLSQSKALGKLIALVALCLVFANILVSLLTPVIEEFIPEE